uniref:RanBP2-type domain-containing protein n=1 Tax=Meloidogyne incognita TaxID=6306 RepID=A0A914KMD8_MELIC
MSVDNWSCPNCTLINNIQEHCCKACLYSFNKNNRNGFLRKLKLPHFSVNSALEKLDSALDLITNSPGRSSTSQQNVQIYPQLNHSPAIWKCSSCSQLNNHSGKKCVWCNLARETGKFNF